MRRATSPTAFVFPTSSGKTISYHNYERDVIVPAAIRASIMPKPAPKRPKGSPKRNKVTAVNFQAFRRTFATWMQKNPYATVKDVRGAMRHSSPDQTLEVYMKEIPGGVRNAVEALDKLLNQWRGLTEAKPEGGIH